MRNIDEWLCNLYIEVKKIELFDFRFHEEKIEFLVPKKFLKEYEKQQKKAALMKSERENGNDSSGGELQTTAADSRSLKSSDNSESDEDDKTDYSSSDGSVDSDIGFESGFAA